MKVLLYFLIIFISISCKQAINIKSNFGLGLSTSGVNNFSNQDSGAISFLSKNKDSAKLIYECSLNGAAFETCTSPYPFASLVEGTHTFQLKARLPDNSIKDSLTLSWVVDLTVPTASFNSTPQDPNNSTLAAFNFGGNDGVGSGIGSYECSLDSGAFTLCSSIVPFLGLSTGTHNLEMRAVDRAGNKSTSVSYSWLVDLVAPSITINSDPGLAASVNSATFNFSANDTGGSLLGNLECRLDSAAYAACVSPVALSSLAQGQHTFNIRAYDGAGNITTVAHVWTVDLTDPQISTFSVANGAPVVGIRLTTTQLSTVIGGSAITEMRFSELADFSNTTWEDFSAAGSFMLSNVSGDRIIYAQVRSAAGRVSNILQTTVNLEVGTPPVVAMVSPGLGETHAPGDPITVSWTCSPGSVSSPLATAPITSIQYTIDDGSSWNVIATNLTNNLSATEGNYVWTLPSTSPSGVAITGTTAFKISVACSSLSGIVSNGMSALQNSIWNIFAGEPGNISEGVHIDAADLSSLSNQFQGFVSNSKGEIFYSKGHGISHIDPQSGLVSNWVGNMYSKGCDPAQLKFTAPQVVGVTQNDEIFIYSHICSTMTKINSLTKAIVWTKQLPPIDVTSSSVAQTQLSSRTYLNSGYFFYYSGNAFYMLDMNNSTSAPVLVWGTPGVCGTVGTVGTEAAGSPIPCNTSDIYQLAVRPDLAKMWVRVNGLTFELLRTPAGTYQINSLNKTEWGAREFSNCVAPLGESHLLYCRSAEGTGNKMGVLDLNTEVWKAIHTVTGQYKNMSVTLGLGATHQNYILLFSYQTNELFKYSYDTATPSMVKVGGSPFFSYGNGTGVDPASTVFTQISSIAYDSLNHNLYVRAVRHLRKFSLDPVTSAVTSISTAFHASAGNSSAYGALTISNDGLAAFSQIGGAAANQWNTYNLATFNPVAESISTGVGLYTGAGTGSYPLLTDIINSAGTTYNLFSKEKYATFLSDNNLYFCAYSDSAETQNHWIFKSDRGTSKIYAVAGATGVPDYNPAHSGGAALGASLKRVYGMQPDTNNDLLIFDGDHLRKITLTTESGAPKIYDLADFSSYPNYPAGTRWTHAVHDKATGWNYFVVSNDINLNRVAKVWAAHNSTDGFIEISTAGLQLSSEMSNMKSLELAVTPLGLLLLDMDKKRILVTPLLP